MPNKVCLGKCQRERTLTDLTTIDSVHHNAIPTLARISFELTVTPFSTIFSATTWLLGKSNVYYMYYLLGPFMIVN